MNLPHCADKNLNFLIAWGLGGTKPHACGAAASVNASQIDMGLIYDASGKNLLSFYIKSTLGGPLASHITICGKMFQPLQHCSTVTNDE